MTRSALLLPAALLAAAALAAPAAAQRLSRQEQRIAREQLQQMVHYAEISTCRRAASSTSGPLA